jgi:hypothetical protein
MGSSQSSIIRGTKTSPFGVVAGPFIGDPVTCLEVCTAKSVRGDILVGQAGGQLRMYSLKATRFDKTEEEGMDSGYHADADVHVRFRKQPKLPRTDGVLQYKSDYSVLSIIKDENVHSISGAYSDGKRCYTVARNMGGKVVPLRENTDEDHEIQYKFTVPYMNTYGARSSSYLMQHRKNFIILAGGKDGASIDGKDGYEVEVRQPFNGMTSASSNSKNVDEDYYKFGLKLEKRDVPVFFDGEYLVVMRTRSDSEEPTKKERTITVYGGWGRSDDIEEGIGNADVVNGNNEGEKDTSSEAGRKAQDIEVDLDDSVDSMGSIAPSEIDPREYDPTEGLYVVAALKFQQPPSRKNNSIVWDE